MKLLREAREAKNLRVRDVADATGIDQALVCKFESGERIPTEVQARALATLLSIPNEDLQVFRLARKILAVAGTGDRALKAIRAAEAEITGVEKKEEIAVEEILQEMDVIRAMLLKKKAGQGL